MEIPCAAACPDEEPPTFSATRASGIGRVAAATADDPLLTAPTLPPIAVRAWTASRRVPAEQARSAAATGSDGTGLDCSRKRVRAVRRRFFPPLMLSPVGGRRNAADHISRDTAVSCRVLVWICTWFPSSLTSPGSSSTRACSGGVHSRPPPSTLVARPMTTGTMPRQMNAGRKHRPSGPPISTPARSARAAASSSTVARR